jgi:hypothetical protein
MAPLVVSALVSIECGMASVIGGESRLIAGAVNETTPSLALAS